MSAGVPVREPRRARVVMTGAALTAALAVALLPGLVPAPAAAAPLAPLRWGACPAGQVQAGLPPLECSRVGVPLDHADPSKGRILLAVYRAKLPAGVPRPGRVLFVNPGGPGGEASQLTSIVSATYPAAVRRAYDVVGVDPRGVGRSVPVSCLPPPTGEPEPTPDLRLRTQAQRRAALAAAALFTQSCFARAGGLVPYLTTDQTARDFDVVRARLGVRRAAFVGYSYGTLLFSRYATLFPGRVERLVLDSAVDPRSWGQRLLNSRAAAFERRLEAFAAWAGRHDAELGLGATRDEVLASYDRIVASLGVQPVTADGRPVGAGDVQLLVTSALPSERTWVDLASILALVRAAVDGAPAALAAPLPRPAPDNRTSARYSILCNDGDFPDTAEPVFRRVDRALRSTPRIGALQVAGALPCLSWPLPPTPVVVRNVPGAVPLVLQSRLDPSTPYPDGPAMARLTGGRLLTVGGGNHTHFGVAGERCTDAAVAGYLLRGTLPAPGAFCPGAPLPDPGARTASDPVGAALRQLTLTAGGA